MAKGYLLSESDLKLIRGLLSREERPRRVRIVSQDGDRGAPDTYVVRTPAGGIAGLTVVGSRAYPGSAECEVWYRTDLLGRAVLLTAGFSLTVFNFGCDAVGANRFICAVRDKFGSWLALDNDWSVGTGTGTGA